MKELADKQKAKDKNYEVTMTVRIQANSKEHAVMKLDSAYFDLIDYQVTEI